MEERKELPNEFIAKWLRVLMYVAIAGFANTLVGLLPLFPDPATAWISRLIMVVMIYSLFRLAPANDRYRKSAGFRAILVGVTVLTEVFSAGSVFTFAASILSIMALYQEYHGHSELIADKDDVLSGKWSSLFLWSIVAGVIVGFASTAAVMFVAMAEMDTGKAIAIIVAVLGIPQYIIEILYILYVKKMAAAFQEQ